jgi:hypothetical protein
MGDWKGAKANTDRVAKAYFSWRETVWRVATEIKMKQMYFTERETPYYWCLIEAFYKPNITYTKNKMKYNEGNNTWA